MPNSLNPIYPSIYIHIYIYIYLFMSITIYCMNSVDVYICIYAPIESPQSPNIRPHQKEEPLRGSSVGSQNLNPKSLTGLRFRV